MRYRVAFVMFWGQYFTEWFDTLDEAAVFVRNADNAHGAEPLWVENEDGEVI